jgi:hypothetical protein
MGAILNILSILSWVNTPKIGGCGITKAAAWGLTLSQGVYLSDVLAG